MGRPPVEFDSEQIKQVEHLAAVLTQVQIADFFSISDNTLRKIMERQEEVSSAYKRGRAKAVASVATSLLKQAQQGSYQHQSLYLRTQAGWTENAPQQTELPPLTINVVDATPKPDLS
jgi:hypothetical protein